MRLLLTIVLLTAPLFAQRKVISPPEFAPAPGAQTNFSPAILVDGTLYISGQIGRDLKTKSIPADFEAEVKACLDDIGVILKAANMKFDDVVAVQIYLTDMDLFEKMNGVYRTYFKEPRPSRTTVGVTKLAASTAHIEITVMARAGKK
jgi:reactive intermediate/imine deaminase